MADFVDEFFDKPRRQGASGRIPDSQIGKRRTYVSERYTCPPDVHDRLLLYCADHERAKSWVIQKALDKWLEEQGY